MNDETPPPQAERPFTPSQQQCDFFDFLQYRCLPDGSPAQSGSCVLVAVAGAGKTETLVRGIGLMRGSVVAMAFNKAAALELKERATSRGVMRQGLFISTAHGAGYSAFARYLRAQGKGDPQVVEQKVSNILDRMAAEGYAGLEGYTTFIRRMVSLGKQMLGGVKWDIANQSVWMRLMEHYDCDGDLPEDADPVAAIELVRQVFVASGKLCAEGVIDYDDMIWAPLAYNARFYQNDWVLIDEAQDTNPARRELARRMLKPQGRLVAVGDDRQAIYGFTGASADALEQIRKEFHADTLNLTISYRCPQLVVQHAHRWVQHIEAHPTAPEGVVRTITVTEAKNGKRVPWYTQETFTATDMILCRYTKPIISTAYGLLKHGIACRVEGRDIGLGLINLARRWKVKTLDALDGRLVKWLDREILKARKAKSEAKEQAAIDKVDTLRIFMERCREQGSDRVDCVVKEIEDMFADNVSGILTLSSIHKAKGRERPRIYWMLAAVRARRELKPHEQLQEDNLCYVATTRAQQELALVPEAVQ